MLQLEDAVRVAVQVLSALEAAHTVGVVHRDVKPTNVLRFDASVVKLADFGIALSGDTTVRSDGALGTLAYCAPEQMSTPDRVDARADLYAVGALLYELLTGHSPRLLYAAAARSERWTPMPSSVRTVVRSAMALRPDARFPSARAMAEALLDAVPVADRSVLWSLFRSCDATHPPASRPPAETTLAAASLHAAYADGLVARALALEGALNRLDGIDRASAAEGIRSTAHQLAGSAGAYGLPALSARAAEVEHARPEQLASMARLLVSTLRSIQSGRRTGGRILVVADDDALVGELDGVVPAGTAVTRARTAAAGLADLERAAPDLLLVDLELGDDDARAVVQQARGVPTASAVPIVVFAPTISPEIRSELYAVGTDEVSPRHATPPERRALLERLLAGATPGPDRRTLRAAIHECRRRFVLEGERYCVAVVAWLPGSLPLAEPEHRLRTALEAYLGGAVTVAHWDDDALAVVIPDVHASGGELLLNVALHRIRQKHDRIVVSAGMVAPDDGSVTDTLVQAEHLARVALGARTDHVVLTTLEPRAAPRVAVCDDDPSVLYHVVAVLEANGLLGIPFASGEALLRSVGGLGVSAIVLDVNLEARDGFSILAELRATPATNGIPVVMLTALGGDAQVARAFDLGADDWVSKPFSPTQLAARIRRLLRRVR